MFRPADVVAGLLSNHYSLIADVPSSVICGICSVQIERFGSPAALVPSSRSDVGCSFIEVRPREMFRITPRLDI